MFTSERNDELRKKFIRNFAHFGSNLRFPAPFAQFTGKPDGKHDHILFDNRGFRNNNKASYLPDGLRPRVFVLGGSTMVEGDTEEDTVSGRLQVSLKEAGYHEAQVFNFGVVSTSFKQMSALAWSHLADLQPDALVVVGGGTDITNPWTFDPRPGYPYNAFVIERVYDFLFDTNRIASRELGLSYDELTDILYEKLERLRAECQWRTPEWEHAVADSARDAVRSFSRLASALRVPVLCILQPTIVRKKHLSSAEKNAGSDDFIAYLGRQYQRLEDHFRVLKRLEASNMFYSVHDLSRKFEEETGQIFYDAAHYIAEGRQMMADDLSAKLEQVLNGRLRSGMRWAVLHRRIRSLVPFG